MSPRRRSWCRRDHGLWGTNQSHIHHRHPAGNHVPGGARRGLVANRHARQRDLWNADSDWWNNAGHRRLQPVERIIVSGGLHQCHLYRDGRPAANRQLHICRHRRRTQSESDQFLAFGDSITAGEVPDSTDSSTGRIRLRILQPALAYPAQLQMMLAQRYPAQSLSISVVNDGVQGETAVDGAGRLDNDLAIHRPDVPLCCKKA